MPNHPTQAALAALIIVHGVMLAALLAGVEPHPPATIPLFGMAPFLAAFLAVASSALLLGPAGSRAGMLLAALAALLSLVSFGPHKFLDPALPLIWPGLVTVWVAIVTLAIQFTRTR